MEIYKSLLESDDAASWEQAYLTYVTNGKVNIDEYVLDWIMARFQIPESEEYSIFTPHIIVDGALLNVRIKIETQYQGKSRFVQVLVWTRGELNPGFECLHEPDAANSRFESIGNPQIDTPNYRKWEEYLLVKLSHEVLFEKGGLDAIIEAIHRHR